MPRQVYLLSSQNFFICRTCLGQKCSVKEKVQFKSGEDVLEEVEKFYFDGMFSCYDRASEAVSARIGTARRSLEK